MCKKGETVPGHDKKPFTKENAREMQRRGAEALRRKNAIVNLCTDCVRKILSSQMPIEDGARACFEKFGIVPNKKESVLLVGLLRAWQKVYSEKDIKGLETFVKLGGLYPEQEVKHDSDDNEIRVTITDA